MTQVTLELKGCSECPFVKVEKVYTSDSWDNVMSYYCTKKNKMIDGYNDTWDEAPSVPEWCPIKT